ncbi:lactaldehyde reductase [Polaribacter sejongensis]|uniref:Iron-containing alcohol dehydrogenase n=1 Tax=Polaribacter sejongensis TaxID=985043 RepID=A0AAJ1R0E8_9FLAO|nr:MULTISPECIES: iron-containing alcohol dehydrogenase [Polaribacter]AUC23913.1 lactaldehyde reductase [Polaribacter sejongensis]MDN3621385.1 iron-containing alcohol dehydrogenase [Polaribacter undariae]UWD31913.1 iron-containing alcohol dehydrogenase [Polaribacter undariae]
MLQNRRIYLPPLSLIGPGALNDLGEELKSLPYKKALFVTDEVLVKIGVAQKIIDVMEASDIEVVLFDKVQPNPTCQNVNAGLELLKDNSCDFVLTLGGGSPQDCGKAIGILATNGGDIKDYDGINMSKKAALPIVAINTTAGTASEVTINYVITDAERHIKMVMVDKNCLVSIAVNDPELMIGMPAGLTAATGMDALTHAIETYVTKGAFGWSDALALEAIKLISQSLEIAVVDSKNLEARSKMAWGQFIAGQAFSNAGLGYVHSMAHQLGGMYDMPHGVANAILLPHVEAFNLPACAHKLKRVARAMGVGVLEMSDTQGANAAISAIKALSKSVGIPSGLKELGVKEEDFAEMAKNALEDVCTGGNPREVTLEDTIAIYKAAM